MQFNRYIALPKSSLYGHKLFFLFRVVMFAFIAIYLWKTIVANQKVLTDLGAVSVQWQMSQIYILLLIFALLPLNWLLEGLKWQVIATEANLSLKQAIRGVVLGLTLDIVLPLGSGAISGRILTLSDESRIKVIPGILVGQLIQSSITFLFGLYGFWLVWAKASSLFQWQPFYTYSLVGISLIVILAVIFWRENMRTFLSPLWQYSIRAWSKIFLLSLSRYLVFIVQFILLAFIFAPEIDVALMLGCATWVFAAKTFMPKISNMEKLGIRALAVVFFMNLFHQPLAGTLMTVILLWFINLAIPSIVGLSIFKDLKTDTQVN